MTNEYLERKRAEYEAVMRGDAPPDCFTCGDVATHVTNTITPAGYHAWQCDRHAPKRPAPLWGSDPGWQTRYLTLDAAREQFVARESEAA